MYKFLLVATFGPESGWTEKSFNYCNNPNSDGFSNAMKLADSYVAYCAKHDIEPNYIVYPYNKSKSDLMAMLGIAA